MKLSARRLQTHGAESILTFRVMALFWFMPEKCPVGKQKSLVLKQFALAHELTAWTVLNL